MRLDSRKLTVTIPPRTVVTVAKASILPGLGQERTLIVGVAKESFGLRGRESRFPGHE
jgi:hypothetical protein